MSLRDLAIRDAKHILGDSTGFSTPVTFSTPDGTVSKTINAMATRHSFSQGTDGVAMVKPTVHCSFAEATLVAAGYTVRGADGKVDMKGHRVTWTDATNIEKTYLVETPMPDETLGIILLRLGLFNG